MFPHNAPQISDLTRGSKIRKIQIRESQKFLDIDEIYTYIQNMKQLLIKLYIIQVVSNEERHEKGLKRLGKGYFNAYRLNPFNPLSYIVFVLVILTLIPLYGFVGMWEQTDIRNPFKWN